jgi:tetratricopeptide (TPR) repeat protein/predicted Ser/Thr protein kinase
VTIAVGTVIAGRYKMIRLLGEGGFGAVYLAQDTHLGNKQVAVKESFDNSREAQDQFRLEAQLLANLQHIGLPRVTDHFIETSGRQFLVMDFIEGADLDNKVTVTSRPLGEHEAASIMLQVCEAVAYLHTRRPQAIIHRDIKPSNIKISPSGHATLVDFGIAKIYHPNKATAKIAKAVTPCFSPPEQYIGKTDTRSDVYALGATLYFLICAMPPPDAMERLTQGVVLVSPRKVNSTINPALEQIILQSMDLAPDRRYENANRLSAALRAFLNGQPVPHVGVSPAVSGNGLACPRCGFVNRLGAKFCARDGTKLVSTPQPQGAAWQNQSPELLFEVANAYARNDDYQKAIPCYEECLKKGLTDAAIYHNIGLCYLRLGRPADAAAILRTGASQYPKDADIQYQMARAYEDLNQSDKAIACAAQACKLDPGSELNFGLYGLILISAKKYSEAIRQFERCIQIKPGWATSHVWLGRAYGYSGDLKRSISELQRAARLDSKSIDPLVYMGIFYGQAKKYREAVSALESALRLAPNSAVIHYYLGDIWLKQDQYSKALPHFEKADALQPNDVDNLTSLGLCYALMGRRSEAISTLQKALNIDPAAQLARELLGKL